MGRPGIPDPECYVWLLDHLVNRLKEECESQGVHCTPTKMKRLVKKKVDERIAEWTAIWLEANHDEYIENFDNDEEALREHAQEETVDNLYENCVDELAAEILEELPKNA
jgi:hypothetical protein